MAVSRKFSHKFKSSTHTHTHTQCLKVFLTVVVCSSVLHMKFGEYIYSSLEEYWRKKCVFVWVLSCFISGRKQKKFVQNVFSA